MPDVLQRLKSALADRYAVESAIGRGGMAVVFLARDLRHERQVAIKVLHPELTATLGAERFLNEIKTVAGLQHPHILPLYESGEADGLLYYVMPYAEGESLRQRLDRHGQMGVNESVRIAMEVADGLDYAHRKGVIHRDIKPGNILLAEGHATIADFGIARAIEAAREERVTTTGLGVGTPLYASPEQVAGEGTVDGRADIYSLGCVLYEMLAGEPPLTGATPKMIQARRMSETPTALHFLRDTVPPALDHVIGAALARVPADRFATAADFGRALQAATLASTPVMPVEVTPPAYLQGAAAPGRAPPRARWRVVAPILLGVAVVAAATLWLTKDWRSGGSLQITVSGGTVVTHGGAEVQPAISPDGSEVAYVDESSRTPRVVVRSTAEGGGGGGVRPAGDAAEGQFWPSWTPDGQFIRFCTYSFPRCDWKQVGRLGGFIQTIDVARQSFQRAWSRDGSRSVFSAGNGPVSDSIYVEPERAEPRLAGVHVVNAWGPHSFAWSPDGTRIAYVNGNPYWVWGSPNVAVSSIWVLDSRGGEPMRVTEGGRGVYVSPQWLPDGRHLLFVSDRDGARGIYAVEVGPEGPLGPARSVLPSSDPHTISISADGRKLAYSRLIEDQNVWSIPIPRSGTASISEAVQVTRGKQLVELHDESPDGEWLAFASMRRGGHDIYRQRVDAGEQQLVADLVDGYAFDPQWSPDGTEIAFYSDDVFVVPSDGGTPEVVADLPGFDGVARWSPDGLAIAFESEGREPGPPNEVWMVTRERVGEPWSEPVQVTDFGCSMNGWAPDGESLLCNAQRRLARVSMDGTILGYYDPPPGLTDVSGRRLSPDGSRLYFSALDGDGWAGVWWVPAEGGNPTKVVAYDDPSRAVKRRSLTVGRDRLYFTIDENESDIRVVDLEW
jgi:serine/threonine-protein kinase